MAEEQWVSLSDLMASVLGIDKERIVVVYDSSGQAQRVSPVLHDPEEKVNISLSQGETLREIELPFALYGKSRLEIWSWIKSAGLDDIGESRPPH